MRLTRVFVDAPLTAGARVVLPADAAAHLARVLRLSAGDACVLFNGQGGEFQARIATAGKRDVCVELGAHDPVERESPLRVVLLQGLARGERMDFIVQKATELGVAAIRSLHTVHSGVKLDAEQAARKVAHWRAVAISACEQCGRNRLPDLLPLLSFDSALQAVGAASKLMLSLGTASQPSRPLGRISPIPAASEVAVLVGPEGGFAVAEEASARAAGFQAVHLGPRVLRTETAGLAALAALGALQGDLAADTAIC